MQVSEVRGRIIEEATAMNNCEQFLPRMRAWQTARTLESEWNIATQHRGVREIDATTCL